MLHLGTSYYPEHFPSKEWDDDLKKIKDLGLDCVRIGDFAWSRLEPREGQYQSGWLQGFIEKLTHHDLKFILCTPTAAPPRWLSQRYPETLSCDQHGRAVEPGGRKHFCPSSETYLRLARGITEKLVESFGKHPNLILWQIDNEMSAPRSYSKAAEIRFLPWLQRRYGTLDQLNRAWGAFFWGGDFSDWNQVRLPRPPMGGKAAVSKAMVLDLKRFWSDEMIAYLQMQIGIIRGYCPETKITTNWSPIFDYGIDFHRMASLLDFPSWDNYSKDYVGASFSHDFVSGCHPKSADFLVMEQECAPPDSGRVNPLHPDGWLHRAGIQNVLHGAKGIVLFSWRAFPYGAETEHGAVISLNGDCDTRTFRELKTAIPAWRECYANMGGGLRTPQIGILMDFQNWWALGAGSPFKVKRRTQLVDYREILAFWQGVLRSLGFDVMFFSPENERAYACECLVIPTLPILLDKDASRIQQYVSEGGLLLTGPQTGIWDESGNPLPHPKAFPYLACKEMDCLSEEETIGVSPVDDDGSQFSGRWIVELLRNDPSAKIHARFCGHNHPLHAAPAVLEWTVGEGRHVHCATHPGAKLIHKLISLVLMTDTGEQDFSRFEYRWNRNGKFASYSLNSVSIEAHG